MIFRLTAGYKEREQVKALGARFNFQEKYWYYEGDTLPEGLMRWYAAPQMDLTSRDYGEARIELEGHRRAEGEGAVWSARQPAFQTVSQVGRMISDHYKDLEQFQHILVKGEVTNYSGHTGAHYYFDIKDEHCQLKCRLWEQVARRVLHFELAKGQLVGLSGRLEYYEKDGVSQLIVGDIMNLGAGDANLALLELKNRLEAEGLFSPEHKKPIPAHPKAVGIITSKGGQAIKDICQKAKEKDPYVQLILYHVNVQGKNAIPTILRGIRVMDEMGVDTLIIGRGGGSDEELMVYNDEAIVRAVYAANTPIISAVGHEGHWTLIDHVADFRVSTPTSAADHALPNVMQDVKRLRSLQTEMKNGMRYQLEKRGGLLRAQMATLEKNHPERRLKEQKARLSAQQDQLHWSLERIYREREQRFINERADLFRNMQRILQEKELKLSGQRDRLKWNFGNAFAEKKHRFEMLVNSLNGLSPTAKLVKGFGYISVEGRPLVSVEEVKSGDGLVVEIHDGQVEAKVTGVHKKPEAGF